MGGIFQDQGQSFPDIFYNWNDGDNTGKECRASSSLWFDLLETFVSNSVQEDNFVLCIHSALSPGDIFPSPIHLENVQCSYELMFYLFYELFPKFP